jgi:hypothetical protein
MSNSVPAQANVGPALGGAPRPGFGDLAADALRYWEPRCVLYNVVLLAVVCIHFYTAWPGSKEHLERDTLFLFFILAVLANIAYCAAYAVDLFVQFSGLRGVWPRWRWTVLLMGTAFAAVLAHFFSLGILGEHPPD